MEQPALKLLCHFNFISFNYNLIIQIKYMTDPALYCSQCQFPFKQMGACPAPGKSMIYAYISILPYLFPFIVLISAIITKKLSQFKIVTLLVSAYIFGDKVLKKIIQSPRPPHSCKKSFGMPSSHMIVMVTMAFYRIRNSEVPLWQKIVWFLLSVGEGVARMELNYHTIQQVLAGSVAAIIYTLIFENIWKRIEPYLQQKLQFLFPIYQKIPSTDQ